MSPENEPPVITLSIQIQYSQEEGEWVASSRTHKNLNGHGETPDAAFKDLCQHETDANCGC